MLMANAGGGPGLALKAHSGCFGVGLAEIEEFNGDFGLKLDVHGHPYSALPTHREAAYQSIFVANDSSGRKIHRLIVVFASSVEAYREISRLGLGAAGASKSRGGFAAFDVEDAEGVGTGAFGMDGGAAMGVVAFEAFGILAFGAAFKLLLGVAEAVVGALGAALEGFSKAGADELTATGPDALALGNEGEAVFSCSVGAGRTSDSTSNTIDATTIALVKLTMSMSLCPRFLAAFPSSSEFVESGPRLGT